MLIVLSGSTCVGKSSVGAKIVELLLQSGERVRYLNETNIHSKDLRMMFREPSQHAFYVQCEFLIRRTTTLLWEGRRMSRQATTVVERFITDDMLFEEYWRSKDCITAEQHELYTRLWQDCQRRLPTPDLNIYLRCPPQIAACRLHEREGNRRAKREVPADFVKQYVYELTEWYERFVQANKIKSDLVISSDRSSLEDIKGEIGVLIKKSKFERVNH